MGYELNNMVMIHKAEVFDTYRKDDHGIIWTPNNVNIVRDMYRYFGRTGTIYSIIHGGTVGDFLKIKIDGEYIDWWWCESCIVPIKKKLFDFTDFNLIL